MKTLRRNHITLFYALVDSMTDTVDDNGNLTGTPTLDFKSPVRTRMSWSARKGGIALTAHGLEDEYDVTLITDDMSCPIDKGTRIWIGKCPMDGNGQMTAHTHVVKAVIPTFKSITYRLTEVAQP